MRSFNFALKPIPIGLGLLCLVFSVWLQLTNASIIRHWINQLDAFSYDMQLRAALIHSRIDNNIPIAIVDIDDKSLKEQGRWPWPRNKLASLVKRLYENGATVIALDMLFPEAENNIALVLAEYFEKSPAHNKSLITMIRQAANDFNYNQQFADSLRLGDAVLGVTFHNDTFAEQGELPAPLAVLTSAQQHQLVIKERQHFTGNMVLLQKAAKGGGFINAYPDEDGIVRHAQLLIRYKNSVYPSLALEAAKLYALVDKVHLLTEKHGKRDVLEGIYFDQQPVYTDAKGSVLIPFRGYQGSFPYFSATDVLEKKLPADAVKNKLIFIGSTAAGLGDIHATAVQSAYAGVEVHANIAAGILNNHFPYRPAWAIGAEFVSLVILGLIAAIIFPYIGPWLLVVTSILLEIALFYLNAFLWKYEGIVLSAVLPMLLVVMTAVTNLAYGYLFEGKRREQLKLMFGQYVPPEHVEKMLTHKGDYGFLGETREMSVLFADIRNFTTISEKMEAAKLKEMLNEFFTPMTQVIFDNKGTIDKYVGDMIMAFWGAPLEDAFHARHAIQAALSMQKKAQQMHEYFFSHYNIVLKIGIGINTGHVSVGDMGSSFRRSYTVLGDNVNLASRLEGLSKFYGVGIVVGENTYQQCQTDFIFRLLDRVKVKGKDIAVKIFEPICSAEQTTNELSAELALYQQALDHYYQQKWEQAKAIFQKLKIQAPGVYLYDLYLSRIALLENSALDPDWDGVYVSRTK